MDEQTQEQFLQWLAQKLGVNSQEELEGALQEMDEEQINEAINLFQEEMQAQAFKQGGKIDYLKRLQGYKKGGMLKEGKKGCKTAVGGIKESTKKDNGSTKSARKGENKKQWLTAVNKK